MTFFSLAEATRHLNIDAKTLHRWMADAHLCLQCHPHDGRKKGISAEQLSLLARRHHRRVASLSQEPPISLSSEEPSLPAALLTLPEQLAALQTQIVALHQHMADLTHLLTQHASVPPSRTVSSSPKPTRTRPTAKTPPSRRMSSRASSMLSRDTTW